MESLKELIQSKPEDLNKELKRAFRPLTPHIKIDGKELDALTVLVNLTDRTDDQKNLLDRAKCKEKLRDDKWWRFCLNTIEYIHSHNVKFPDIRSDGIIRASAFGSLPEHLLSSSKLPQHFWAYSHDSKYVNKSAFLTSEFCWEGSISCLTNLLQDESHILWTKLLKLGCYKKTQKAIAKKLRCFEEQKTDVSLTGNYLTQLSLPDDEDSYISLSPVASQAMQSHCYQLLENEYRYMAISRYSRSTNMGVLAMSCGGTFKMLKSFSNFSNSQHCKISNHYNWLTSQHVQALKKYQSFNHILIPANKRNVYRDKVKHEIRAMISKWLITKSNNIDASTLVQQLNDDLSRINSTKRFAYEPQISKLLYGLMKSELQNPNIERPDTTVAKDNGTYLVLPSIRVCGATAQSTPVTIGIPSLTAFYGFTHAFERNLKVTIPTLKIESFAVCLHELHVEKRGITKEFVEKANETISSPATHDDWQCDLIFSLVLKLKQSFNIDEQTLIKSLPKRLARGATRIAIDDFKYVKTYSEISEAIQSIPMEHGKWLSVHTETMENLSDVLAAVKNDRNLSPTCIGYHFLETPVEKPDSLRGYKHALSECIIGLVKPITFNTDTDINSIFLCYRNHGNYLAVQPRSIQHGTTN